MGFGSSVADGHLASGKPPVLLSAAVLILITVPVSASEPPPSDPEPRTHMVSPGALGGSRNLGLGSRTACDPGYFEMAPFAPASEFTGALDFNPLVERYFFSTGEQLVGTRGIFSEAAPPIVFTRGSVPVCPTIAGSYTPSLLPLVSHRKLSPQASPRVALWQSPSSAGGVELANSGPHERHREVVVTVGDEAGDAMMLDFVGGTPHIQNRGSVLGLEVGMGDSTDRGDRSWWARARYRKNDWLSYRRHRIRTPIAPVEDGRENIGTEEKLIAGGGVDLVFSPRGTANASAFVQMFPAIWIRDPGTRRTTKWRGASGFAVLNVSTGWGNNGGGGVHASLASEVTRATDVHRDSDLDSRFDRHVETVWFGAGQRLLGGTRFSETAWGRVERIQLVAEGNAPSRGYEGPSSRVSGGLSVGASHEWGRKSVGLDVRVDKREGSAAISSVHVLVDVASRFRRVAWVRVLRSGVAPDLFHEYGWATVAHSALGPEGIRFEGRPLDPEKFELLEAGVVWSLWAGVIGRTALYHERVRDRIVAASTSWFSLGDNLERVRSGYWTNGGRVTSTGVEVSCGGEGRRGGVWGFLFVRDVRWRADRRDVTPPPLGGKLGAGILGVLRLPKRTEFLTRLRSIHAPRFPSYGSWTEDTGSDRLRWDAALTARLSKHWHATITALDILDDGHIEIPGGNAVGFRVAGELRYTR